MAKDNTQIRTTKNIIKDYSYLRVIENEKANMAFILTGIWRGCENNELKKMICNGNKDIKENFGTSFINDTKIIGRSVETSEKKIDC